MSDTENEQPETPTPVTEYPDGNYAIVEVMGHVRHIGLWQDVERFGQKFCEVRPILDHVVQPAILVGGASIYQFRECTAEAAYTLTESWEFRQARNPLAQLTYVAPASDEDDEQDGFPF